VLETISVEDYDLDVAGFADLPGVALRSG